jgi:hypothetical protein
VTVLLRRAGLVAVEVALVVAAAALAFIGFGAVLDTTEGRVIDPELDPDATGYEAFVESTPTLAVLGRAEDGSLAWAALLALGGGDDGGGSVQFVPVDTLVPDFDSELETLAETDAVEGAEAAAQAVADILGAAADGFVEIDPARLAQLAAPVGPLTFENPDGATGYPQGPVTVDAAAAATYLDATEPDESDLTRLVRHEAYWMAWLAAIGASDDPGAVPGEQETGIGRFLRGLADGPVGFDVTPVRAERTEDGRTEFRSDPFRAYDATEALIPFPAAAQPGARPRIRVLDGVGADDLAVQAAREVVAAGGQIVVIGNSDRFDADAATRVVYFEPLVAEDAEEIADALGVTAEQLSGPNPDDGVDITVVAGRELLDAYGLVPRRDGGAANGDDPG